MSHLPPIVSEQDSGSVADVGSECTFLPLCFTKALGLRPTKWTQRCRHAGSYRRSAEGRRGPQGRRRCPRCDLPRSGGCDGCVALGHADRRGQAPERRLCRGECGEEAAPLIRGATRPFCFTKSSGSVSKQNGTSGALGPSVVQKDRAAVVVACGQFVHLVAQPDDHYQQNGNETRGDAQHKPGRGQVCTRR